MNDQHELWLQTVTSGDPEQPQEPGVPDLPTEPGIPTQPDQPPPTPVA